MTSPAQLSESECRQLLATSRVGRVALLLDGQPEIIPVNYAASGNVVVFRTDPDTVLNEVDLAQVAFETDRIDETTRSGWSVLVRGYGRDITEAIDPESRELRALPVDSWAAGERSRWYKIEPTGISGRRLSPS